MLYKIFISRRNRVVNFKSIFGQNLQISLLIKTGVRNLFSSFGQCNSSLNFVKCVKQAFVGVLLFCNYLEIDEGARRLLKMYMKLPEK